MIQSVSSFEETANLVGVKRHVLHLWVKKFPLLQPKKSVSGELGFAARDISFAKGLKVLLIDEQKTIQEAQKMLNERGVSYISAYGKEKAPLTASKNNMLSEQRKSSTYHKEPERKKRQNTLSIAEQFKNIFQSQSVTQPSTESISKNTDPTISNNNKIIENDMPQAVVKQATDDNAGTKHFEDNWRDFMHNKGKIASKDEIIAKNRDDQEFADDLIFIDDDENIEDYLKVSPESDNIIAFGEYGVMTQPKKQPSHSKKKDYPHNIIYYEDDNIQPEKSRLSVKNQEKMQHLIAKLDILKSELTVTRDVMTSTLKAFGYSGFGDAYSRHDNKSVY